MSASFPGVMVFVVALSLAGVARADPYRLRADAFVSASPSAGLLVVQGEARAPSYFDAEAMVWTGVGTNTPDAGGDILVMTIRARDPGGRGEVRGGRMLIATGAVRPLQLDGLSLVGRSSFGTSLELFGGMPVERGLRPRDFDWVVGQRLSQRIGEVASAGISYLHRRDEGRIAYEELGLDAALMPVSWFDAGFVGALSLVEPGITDARLSLGLRGERGRLDLFALRRSPSRLLPATSLFAALGSVPSDRIGATILWRAAPRLDVMATGSMESIGGDLAGEQRVRATLRLDDRGDRALGLEVRRQGAPSASWTGVRATVRIPIIPKLFASSEIEIAVPDTPGDRGAVWPWALVALGYRPSPAWDLAAAVEANASPSSVASLNSLLRVSYLWDPREGQGR